MGARKRRVEETHTVRQIEFYDSLDDAKISIAVIVAKTRDGQWVLCKHKERTTLEVPGGHRNQDESPLEAARRELYEETGAIDYTIEKVCAYSIKEDTFEYCGLLCYAEINRFEKEIHSEIECVILTNELPDNWTYPEIQAEFLAELKRRKVI